MTAKDRPSKPRARKSIPTQAKNYVRDPQHIKAEQDFVNFLSDQGHHVIESEYTEDTVYDVDFYYDLFEGDEPVSVSFKAEEDGLKYGDIYVELATEQWTGHKWADNDAWYGSFRQYLLDVLEDNGTTPKFNKRTFGPAWFFTGTAQYYVIKQGDRARLYDKNQLIDYFCVNGFDKILGLSPAKLASQNGKDTICGFIKADKVPFIKEWKLPYVGIQQAA